jgi:hypothetical protein
MLILTAAVGAEAPKHAADVRAVQAARNQVPAAEGGPVERLAVDGACGPRTIAAIARFQMRHFGLTDFRVDRGMGTAKLPGDHPAAAPPPARERVQEAARAPGWFRPRAAGPAERLGVLRRFSGDVLVDGSPAHAGQWLMRGDRVRTLEGAAATIEGVIEMGPSMLVVMMGRGPQSLDAGQAAETSLQSGCLRDWPHRLAGGG